MSGLFSDGQVLYGFLQCFQTGFRFIFVNLKMWYFQADFLWGFVFRVDFLWCFHTIFCGVFRRVFCGAFGWIFCGVLGGLSVVFPLAGFLWCFQAGFLWCFQADLLWCLQTDFLWRF